MAAVPARPCESRQSNNDEFESFWDKCDKPLGGTFAVILRAKSGPVHGAVASDYALLSTA
jgi:hypothetical protein